MRRPLILVACFAPLISGCLDFSGILETVVWLPDSSGFIWTEKNNTRLVLYSLKEKTGRVLIENSGTQTLHPAVSPDGKTILLATKLAGREKSTLRIDFYDLTGERVRQTREFELAGVPKNHGVRGIRLLWGRGTNSVLFADADYAGICNLDKDTCIELKDVHPAFTGIDPCHPDGSGFIAVRLPEKDKKVKGEIVFCDWNGQVRQKIDLPDGLADMKSGGAFCGASWTADGFVVQQLSARMRFDFVKGTVNRTNESVRLISEKGELDGAFPFPDGKTWLCFIKHIEGTGKNRRTRTSLEVQRPNDAFRRQVIADSYGSILNCAASPDGTAIAVRISATGTFVVNSEGVVTAQVW